MVEKPEGDAILAALEAMTVIAEKYGIEVHLSVPVKTEPIPLVDHVRLEEQRRNDFFWFKTQLESRRDLQFKYDGSYVVVHRERVVSFSPNKQLAIHGFLHAVGRDLFVEALVIPVCVRDPDSDAEWENLLMSLDS